MNNECKNYGLNGLFICDNDNSFTPKCVQGAVLRSDESLMSPILLWLELENSSIFSMQEILSMNFYRSQEERCVFKPCVPS